MEKQHSHKRRYKKKRKPYIPIFVGVMFLILGIQMLSLYQKSQEYKEREANLVQELKDEEQRTKDLAEYEAYTQTDEYVVNTARTKLGLVYDNEIIFKEK